MMEYERYLERGFDNETSKRCFGLIKGSGKITTDAGSCSGYVFDFGWLGGCGCEFG